MNRRKFLTAAAALGVAVPVVVAADVQTSAPLALEPLPFREPDPAIMEALRQLEGNALEDNARMINYQGARSRSGPSAAQFRAAFEPAMRRAREAMYDKHQVEWAQVFE